MQASAGGVGEGSASSGRGVAKPGGGARVTPGVSGEMIGGTVGVRGRVSCSGGGATICVVVGGPGDMPVVTPREGIAATASVVVWALVDAGTAEVGVVAVGAVAACVAEGATWSCGG